MPKSEEIKINLSTFNPNLKSLVGFENGQFCRKNIESKLGTFVDLEKKYNKIFIIIDFPIKTINMSFFAGLFGDRVLALGENAFRLQYVFNTRPYNNMLVEKYAKSIIFDKRLEDNFRWAQKPTRTTTQSLHS